MHSCTFDPSVRGKGTWVHLIRWTCLHLLANSHSSSHSGTGTVRGRLRVPEHSSWCHSNSRGCFRRDPHGSLMSLSPGLDEDRTPLQHRAGKGSHCVWDTLTNTTFPWFPTSTLFYLLGRSRWVMGHRVIQLFPVQILQSWLNPSLGSMEGLTFGCCGHLLKLTQLLDVPPHCH